MNAPCTCMECRIRHAIHGGSPTAPFPTDLGAALNALGEVMSEMLAHYSTIEAEEFIAAILDARKHYQNHPSVMAQQSPRGRA